MSNSIVRKTRDLFDGGALRAQLLRGGAGSMAIRVCHKFSGFLLTIVLARMLGAEGYGIYGFALALVMLLAIPAQIGLPQLVVRETAKAQANNNWALMRGLWRWSNQYVILFSVVMVSFGVIVLSLAQDHIAEAQWSTIAVGLALIPLIALGNVRGAALRGLRKVILGQLPESVLRPFLILILIGILLLTLRGISLTPPIAMGVHAIAAFLAFAIGTILLLHARPEGVRHRPTPSYDTTSWRRAAMPLAMLGGLQFINAHTDIIMLGMLREDSEVGVYRVVVQVAALVVFGLQAVNQVIQPHFAQMYSQGDQARLQHLVTMSARAILAFAIPPVLIMLFAGGPLLSLVFGEEYRIGALALAILALGQLINASIGSVGILLNMTGHERDTVIGITVAAISNVTLNSLLIPAYGIEGAALATATTLLIWNIILWYFVRTRLKIESSALGISSH